MDFIKLQFKPGVNRDQTDYSNEGGWYACNKIRFRSGYPEKLGGWTKLSNNFKGVCRQMWNWATTYGDDLLALGTNEQVYIENGGYYYDITPLRSTNPTMTSTATDNCISVASGSNVVTVTTTSASNTVTGNYVKISGVVSAPITVGFTNGSADITGTGLPAVNTPVQFATTGTLPSNFVAGTTYFVKTNTSGTTITVSTTIGGPAISAASAGTGTQTLVGTIGGIPLTEINTSQKIKESVSSTSFTFISTTPATATVSGTGGTAITLKFEIDTGYAISTLGGGWGAGTWSRGAWGLGVSGSGILQPQRDWWLDNFDNDLVLNIRNGAPYWWKRGTSTSPTNALSDPAITLQTYAYDWALADPTLPYTPTEYSNAVPLKVMQLLVSQQDKHLIALGAVPFGSTSAADFDPMLIRWADQDTPTDWIPQQTNTAGDIRVSRGSRIVRGMPTRQEVLIWTDSHLYTLQFLGTSDVFGLQEYADNISVMSPRCMATAANITYWMGQDKFYAYTGRVETLPCTLRDHIFNNINLTYADQVVCGTNEQWNEVWWFYPSANSTYNDSYVIYNHLERIWYYGTIERTAWLDTPLRHYPQAANTTIVSGVANPAGGYQYNHEYGNDDDTDPMISYIESSDFDLNEGYQFMLIRRMIPDVSFANSDIGTTPEATITIKPRNFPGNAFKEPTDIGYDPTNSQRVIQTGVNQYTDQVFMRARARQMAFQIRSENLGVHWQLGATRLEARPDGTR